MALPTKKQVMALEYESDNLVLPRLVLKEDAQSRKNLGAFSNSSVAHSKLNCPSTTKSTVFNYREKYLLAVVKT